MKASESKGKQVLAHLKVHLLTGKTITSLQAWRMWSTSRLAVYVHRLRRDHGMRIQTKIVHEGDDSYAVYSLDIPKKQRKTLAR